VVTQCLGAPSLRLESEKLSSWSAAHHAGPSSGLPLGVERLRNGFLVTLLRHLGVGGRLPETVPLAVLVARLAGIVELTAPLRGLVATIRGPLLLTSRSLGAIRPTVALTAVTRRANDDWYLAAVAEEAPLGFNRPNRAVLCHEATLSQGTCVVCGLTSARDDDADPRSRSPTSCASWRPPTWGGAFGRGGPASTAEEPAG
jgi:hypothetical protein